MHGTMNIKKKSQSDINILKIPLGLQCSGMWHFVGCMLYDAVIVL
jgi:hypothetical protein